MANENAPGAPGIPPRWTSSAKAGVGTSIDGGGLIQTVAGGTRLSPVWFTLSHGILNEIYWPHVDSACTRDLGLIVTDGRGFFSEEKRHTTSEVHNEAGIPAYRLVNTCNRGRYRFEKEIVTDPYRAVVLQRTRFVPSDPHAEYHVYALLAPHLGNAGAGNTAWIGDYKGVPMLFASRGAHALALACSSGWRARSAGYVGISDGWQDLSQNLRMAWSYPRAESGNVALTGEVDLGSGSEFTIALGFGSTWSEAGQRALASVWADFEAVRNEYVRGWREWQGNLEKLDRPGEPDLYRVSSMVLRAHESKAFPGGIIASLSIPWGFNKGDDDLGGYHLVWPRDLVESASGLLAAGANSDAVRVLEFLQLTQEADGHWPQNMWLDGSAYWSGVQMDETAMPILLLELLAREGALAGPDIARYWPMVRRAAAYLVANGPVTGQDRWEEDPGFTPFTLAAEIAALVVAAQLAERFEPAIASILRETADAWNDSIERCIYVTGTDLARKAGVEGYYVRVAPADGDYAPSPKHGFVPIKNKPPAEGETMCDELVSPDFLALVRFGLRAPDDPRILNTVRVVDALLKIDLPQGPVWHRYNGDGYGEHDDGSPFDGTGIGRAWPLLAGERAHYELAAGHKDVAKSLLKTFSLSSDAGGLLPEQLWDAPDIPDRELCYGRPSGSARPLVWAHAEYVKLVRSLRDGRIFDLPVQVHDRYVAQRTTSRYFLWALNNKTRDMEAGKDLRFMLPQTAVVHWSADRWATSTEVTTRDTGLGVHACELPTAALAPGGEVIFTFYWQSEKRWEGTDYSVSIG